MPKDEVDHPSHYTFSELEVIDAIEAWRLGYHLGNVVKYTARASHKGRPLVDLRKAQWYIKRAIEYIQKHPDEFDEETEPRHLSTSAEEE